MKLSQDLTEKMVLLLLTALLTGFVVPYVLRQIDASKAKEHRILEADIARQAKLIEAQSALLDEITVTLWDWRYLAMKVTYYGGNGSADHQRYAAARKDYEAKIWDLLNKYRTQVSRSRRLVSEKGFKTLVSLYDEITELDARLSQVMMGNLPAHQRAAELSKFNTLIRWKVTNKLDEVVDVLAEELGLKAQPERTGRSRWDSTTTQQ